MSSWLRRSDYRRWHGRGRSPKMSTHILRQLWAHEHIESVWVASILPNVLPDLNEANWAIPLGSSRTHQLPVCSQHFSLFPRTTRMRLFEGGVREWLVKESLWQRRTASIFIGLSGVTINWSLITGIDGHRFRTLWEWIAPAEKQQTVSRRKMVCTWVSIMISSTSWTARSCRTATVTERAAAQSSRKIKWVSKYFSYEIPFAQHKSINKFRIFLRHSAHFRPN